MPVQFSHVAEDAIADAPTPVSKPGAAIRRASTLSKGLAGVRRRLISVLSWITPRHVPVPPKAAGHRPTITAGAETMLKRR